MRFKFTCSCGKRLAAYSWMAGRVTECPRCHKTLTIPTPERAAELQAARGEQFVSPYHRSRTEHPSRSRGLRWLLILLAVLLVVLVGLVLRLYLR